MFCFLDPIQLKRQLKQLSAFIEKTMLYKKTHSGYIQVKLLCHYLLTIVKYLIRQIIKSCYINLTRYNFHIVLYI